MVWCGTGHEELSTGQQSQSGSGKHIKHVIVSHHMLFDWCQYCEYSIIFVMSAGSFSFEWVVYFTEDLPQLVADR